MRAGHRYRSFRMKDGRVAALRALRKSDLASLIRFVNSLVGEKRSNRDLGIALDRPATSRSEGEYLDRLLRKARRDEVVSVAAEIGGEIVANSEVTRRTFSGEVKHTGVLGIAVLGGYRGAGLGEAMMRTLLSEARRRGIEVVELDVFSINRAARRLYRKVGFRRVGVVPRKVRRGGRYYDLVTMYADLKAKKADRP